jgi:hypothetical protein
MRWFEEFGAWRRTKFETKLDITEKIRKVLDWLVVGSRIQDYAESGWIDRLGQGVYAFAGDTLNAHGTIKFLQTRVAGLHVAGKSALTLQGVRHNLATREALVLWGNVRFALPEWFTSRFPSRYVAAKLFNWPGITLADQSLTTPPGVTDGLSVSVPERAVLELLYEVGTHQGLEEARNQCG